MKPQYKKRGSSTQVAFSHEGVRYRKSFPNNKQAQRWVNACEAAVLDGQPIPDTSVVKRSSVVRLTMVELCDRALDRYWLGTPGEQTARAALTSLLNALPAKVKAHDMTATVVDNIIIALKKQGLQPSTINRYLTVLRRMLDMAHTMGALRKKVKVTPLPVPTEDRRFYLTGDEIKQINEGFAQFKMYAAEEWLRFAVETGLRPAEIDKLRWRNVEWPDSETKPTEVAVPLVKTTKRRRVPLSTSAAAALYIMSVGQDTTPPNKRVFKKYTAEDFSSDWNKVRTLLNKQDDQDWVPYILRHTFISRLVKAGLPLPQVQQLAGHSRIETTMRYVHLQPIAGTTVLDALGENY